MAIGGPIVAVCTARLPRKQLTLALGIIFILGTALTAPTTGVSDEIQTLIRKPVLLAVGVLSTATIAPLQSLVLTHAHSAPTLSLAVNVGAFNLANVQSFLAHPHRAYRA
ncbi:MAG: hypothetical protein Q4A92_08780 [Corynebacterium sp.]|nr:hypothetical protein [Corynebacterium sp.]